jgi:hypothetical protein
LMVSHHSRAGITHSTIRRLERLDTESRREDRWNALTQCGSNQSRRAIAASTLG